MKIQDKDVYHGAALTQIVEHNSFKALNKAGSKYGHYTVNDNRRLFVKYRTTGRNNWRFIFSKDELAAIRRNVKSSSTAFIVLVCARSTVCCLNEEELQDLIDLTSRSSQWIWVQVPRGGSQHVSGSLGELNHTIPHNAFPAKVLN